jgi:hypothetical protein
MRVVKQIPLDYAAILTIQRGSVNNGQDDWLIDRVI